MSKDLWGKESLSQGVEGFFTLRVSSEVGWDVDALSGCILKGMSDRGISTHMLTIIPRETEERLDIFHTARELHITEGSGIAWIGFDTLFRNKMPREYQFFGEEGGFLDGTTGAERTEASENVIQILKVSIYVRAKAEDVVYVANAGIPLVLSQHGIAEAGEDRHSIGEAKRHPLKFEVASCRASEGS